MSESTKCQNQSTWSTSNDIGSGPGPLYGTWLPGDDRGFVGSLADEHGEVINHNQFATPSALPNTALQYVARRLLKEAPVVLSLNQAVRLSEQLQETARIRNWLLITVAIKRTHIHAVVGVSGDPDPDKILGDLKAYGSRCLNKLDRPRKDWWTRGGSTRKLADEAAVETLVNYVRNQANPLVIWTRMEGQIQPQRLDEPSDSFLANQSLTRRFSLHSSHENTTHWHYGRQPRYGSIRQ